MITMVALHTDDIPELQKCRDESIIFHAQYHTHQIKEAYINVK